MAAQHIIDTFRIVGLVWGGALLMAAAIWCLAAWSSLR